VHLGFFSPQRATATRFGRTKCRHARACSDKFHRTLRGDNLISRSDGQDALIFDPSKSALWSLRCDETPIESVIGSSHVQTTPQLLLTWCNRSLMLLMSAIGPGIHRARRDLADIGFYDVNE
jgi:hypothetical protein